MDVIETREFLLKYRDNFLRLSQILKEVDTVKKNRFDHYSPETRALAIHLVEEWLKTEFALSCEDNSFLPNPEIDNIYLNLEKESYLSK